MKVTVDNVDLFTINETKKKVICNDISLDVFEEDVKRRIAYILAHKYEQCFNRLKKEWVDGGKLAANGVKSIPTDPDALAELIFAQPNYKCRKTKEEESLEEMQLSPLSIEEKESKLMEFRSQMKKEIERQLQSEIAKLS